MTIYINEQMNDQTNHIYKIVDRNPLVSNYYYGHCPKDTIMNSCTNTDIHKQGVLEQRVEPPL